MHIDVMSQQLGHIIYHQATLESVKRQAEKDSSFYANDPLCGAEVGDGGRLGVIDKQSMIYSTTCRLKSIFASWDSAPRPPQNIRKTGSTSRRRIRQRLMNYWMISQAGWISISCFEQKRVCVAAAINLQVKEFD
jgi:hypothetical protein